MQFHDIEHGQGAGGLVAGVKRPEKRRDDSKIFGYVVGDAESSQRPSGHQNLFADFNYLNQFCRIGKYSFLAKCAKVGKDVVPYTLVAGENATPYGLNVEGLRRHGFSRETIAKLRQAYRTIYRKTLTLPEVIAELTVAPLTAM